MQKMRILVILTCLALLALLIFVTSVGFLSVSLGIPKSDVGNKIKTLFELSNPGTSVEILTLTEESGLYKILIKAFGPSGTNYVEVYATKDGKLLTQNVIFVEQSIQQIKRLKDFVDCLDGKGVKIFGLNNQTATLLQLNILGIYSTKLYVSCDGDLVTNCVQANVTQVPSIVFAGRIDPGVKTIEWFELITGCKF
ncbi:MAG: hypothetical protein QW423_00020 [Candidatus Aenigmatarchaeota archaeon]